MLIAPHDVFPMGADAPARHLIDVRSFGEVERGAIPGATVLPILSNEERHRVGLRYAEAGQDAAIEEGRILTEADMPRRAAAWRAAVTGPTAFFCWRGGLRSELAQRFTERADTPRVQGGYKALRAHLMDGLPRGVARRDLFVLTGLTGSGKTEFLQAMSAIPGLLAVDLEEAAEHRGSAFGAIGRQPAQATFDHRVALPLVLGRERLLLVEDESSHVGRVRVPPALFDVMRRRPLLHLVTTDADRLRRIHRAYAVEPARAHGIEPVKAALVAAITKLRQRLSGEVASGMIHALEDADRQGAWLDPEAFRPVVLPLLHDYYDPAYRKGLAQSGREVVAKGDAASLASWVTTQAALLESP